MRPPAWLSALLLCVALVAGERHRACAQTYYNVDVFRPTVGPRDLIIIPQTQPLSHMSLALGSYFSFIFNPLSVFENGASKATSVISNQLQWDLMAAFGLERVLGIKDFDLEIGAVLPVVLFQQSSLANVQGSFLGNVTLLVKSPLYKRLSYAKGIGAALQLRYDLNTGSAASFTSDGVWYNIGFSGIVDYRFGNGALIAAQIGAFARPNWTIFGSFSIGPEFLAALGLEFPFVRRWGLTAVGGVQAAVPFSNPSNCDVNGMGGLRWYANIGVTFTVGVGFDCHLTANPLSIFLAAVWVPAKTREYEAIEFFKKPPEDRDGDGILDSKDECPDEPGPLENHGCPIRDTDKDGIPDNLDRCPLIPGPKKYGGCPMVYQSKSKIEVMEPVNFATDQDVILPESESVVATVAQAIREHPEWQEILIEGHTDIRASDAYNMDLSIRRANAVMRYLVSQGVEPSRLRAQGFGRSRPVAPNNTEEGMALNRRVEYTILRAAPSPSVVNTPQGPVEVKVKTVPKSSATP